MTNRRSAIAAILLLVGTVALGGLSPDSIYYKVYAQSNLWRTDKEGRGLAQDNRAFTWLYSQSGPALDPAGDYIYEVYETTLRRHNVRTGARTDYTLERRAIMVSCGTDGEYVYYTPQATRSVVKVTVTGQPVNVTALPRSYHTFHGFGVARGTLWIAETYNWPPTVYHGYPLTEFNGDSAFWYDSLPVRGFGSIGLPMPVAWDGTYFYGALGGSGYPEHPMLRWDADGNFLDTAMIAIDMRSVMCLTPPTGTRDDAAGTKLKPAVEPASVVRGTILLPPDRGGLLFDANGRNVAELVPGRNDVGRLSPGVYFVRVHPRPPARTRTVRVVLTR